MNPEDCQRAAPNTMGTSYNELADLLTSLPLLLREARRHTPLSVPLGYGRSCTLTSPRMSRAERLINRNRTTRLAFLALAWPLTWTADRLRLDYRPAASIRRALRWAWTGQDEDLSDIRNADRPATVRRRDSLGEPR